MTSYHAGIANHALLFGFFAKEALLCPGGEEALRHAVERYGLQRGARMAARARKDGMPLGVDNYLLYGEWAAGPGEADMRMPALEPEVNLQNHSCAWMHTWEAHGMVPLGRHYCDLVDASLARGFDPELNMETVMYRPGGDAFCDFFFRGRPMSAEMRDRLARNREKLGVRAKKDWDYHTGHLYGALVRTLREDIGAEETDAIEAKAMQAYEREFGRAAADALRARRDRDYDSVDDYPGTEGLEK